VAASDASVSQVVGCIENQYRPSSCKAGLRRMSLHVVHATTKLRKPIMKARKPNMILIVLSVDKSRPARTDPDKY
jgi:hypothetical protein